MNEELKKIKKIYGEEMMHICRDLFPSILEEQGLLLSLLQNHLAPTHSFASDIKENFLYEEFKDWIYSYIDVEEKKQININKTPFKLMDEAGYTLFECKTEDDIQSFRKYYEPDEVLCTIKNGGRLNRCYVFFGVKKNVDDIRRENFSNPKRQDKYGTSVISIQFSKGKINTLSIKNRYNHTVNNPDATFSNNLENIIFGLTDSFERYLNIKINQKGNPKADFLTDTLDYVKANNGKYYKYRLEKNGIYYCENNIIIQDGEVITKYANSLERYIFVDQYIIDFKEKKITLYDSWNNGNDSFIKSINEIGEINKIEVINNAVDKTKKIVIYYDNNKQIELKVNKDNNLIGYENKYVNSIGDDFLSYSEKLSSIFLPEVQTIGDDFLRYNKNLSSISLPKVQIIGNNFLRQNYQLNNISLPEVQIVGNAFLRNNEELSSISLPKVQTLGDNFLNSNEKLSSISLPKVQIIGKNFLYYNKQLSTIYLPELQEIGDYFLYVKSQFSNVLLYTNPTGEDITIREMEQKNEEINNSRIK